MSIRPVDSHQAACNTRAVGIEEMMMRGPVEHKNNPKLAACLREMRDEILRLWIEGVRVAVPASYHHRTPAIVDHLPDFLERLAREFDPVASSQEAVRQSQALGDAHGALRAKMSDFTVAQIQQEYTLLRRAVLATVEPLIPLTCVERGIILDIIDLSRTEAVNSFTEGISVRDHNAMQKLRDECTQLLGLLETSTKRP